MPADGRRAVRLHRHHEHARRHRQLIVARDGARNRHVLPGHADVAAANAAVADQPRRDEPRGVAGDREAQALRRQDHRRVDADHFAARRHQRAAGVAGFSAASVWMMSSISRPDRARSDRPSALTTPAVTECWKPYGLPIAIAICPTRTARESPSVAHGSDGPTVDADHREIGVGILADQVGAHRAAVGQHRPSAAPRRRRRGCW